MSTKKPSPSAGEQGTLRQQPRGRSSYSNDAGRFERLQRKEFDDGWSEPGDAENSNIATTLTIERARSIISRNDSPDIGFNRSINPYRGCEHGCIYCYARPTHAYLGLSSGLDFETKLFYKPEAGALLRQELSKPGYVPERIQLGANTDCYQPIERNLKITRDILQVLSEYQHPLGITTKSHLVTRDIDLLKPLAAAGLAAVVISITSLDRQLSRAMEPRASTPQRRLDAIRDLHAAGIPVIVSVSPMIPGLTDHEMENIMEEAAKAGARYASYTVLRLSHDLGDLFKEWLSAERPDRVKRVMSLVRQTRGGKDNDSRYGSRMRGEGPVADLLASRFRLARNRLGLDQKLSPLRTDLFKVPQKEHGQLTLF